MLFETQSPFEWASQHLHLIGWPFLVYTAWQVSRLAQAAREQMKTAQKKFEEIHLYSTNHVPHTMEDVKNVLGEIKDEIKGQRDDWKAWLLAQANRRD